MRQIKRERSRHEYNQTRISARARLRNFGATLFGAALGFAITASALAADTVTLRVGDQKGGNRSLLEIAGYAKDLAYKIEWSEFPAAAPILEALNAGALDVGYTGDLSFLTVYAAGAPIKAIGGTRSDARTQAILVRKDSPIKTAEDLKGKRLAGTRGGWGQFLIDATLEKAGFKIDDATFAPLGPVDAKIALVAGSIDAWAVWEPYVSYATLEGQCAGRRKRRRADPDHHLHRRIRFRHRHQARRRAGSRATAQQGAAVVARPSRRICQKHRRTHEASRRRAAERLHGTTNQSDRDRRPTIVREVQEASDRATRYGILSKTLDVSKAVDRSFTAAANSN